MMNPNFLLLMTSAVKNFPPVEAYSVCDFRAANAETPISTRSFIDTLRFNKLSSQPEHAFNVEQLIVLWTRV